MQKIHQIPLSICRSFTDSSRSLVLLALARLSAFRTTSLTALLVLSSTSDSWPLLFFFAVLVSSWTRLKMQLHLGSSLFTMSEFCLVRRLFITVFVEFLLSCSHSRRPSSMDTKSCLVMLSASLWLEWVVSLSKFADLTNPLSSFPWCLLFASFSGPVI